MNNMEIKKKKNQSLKIFSGSIIVGKWNTI